MTRTEISASSPTPRFAQFANLPRCSILSNPLFPWLDNMFDSANSISEYSLGYEMRKSRKAIVLIVVLVVSGVVFLVVDPFASSLNNSVDVKSLDLSQEFSSTADQGDNSPDTSAAVEKNWTGPFGDTDPVTSERLQPWLEASFLPSHEFVIRHRLVEIDGDELAGELTKALDTYINQPTDPLIVGDDQQRGAISFDLFADTRYEAIIYRFSLAKNGHVFAYGRILNNGEEQASHVKFEINQNHEVTATFATQDSLFFVEPSPEYPAHVVSQVDQELLSNTLSID